MIEIRHLTVRAGAFALQDVSLRVERGQYSVLMGRTGSGKTTLLEAITGLRRITVGVIQLNGRDVTRLKPGVRGIGYVPQDGALFSTMTVQDHLAYALEVRHASRSRIRQRVAELAALLEIETLLDRTPQRLSGGERQRVALGRALSFHPSILLLDEPLSALDAETRTHMYGLIRHLREQTGVTALHVTHNKEEAEQLGDCVLRIDGGQVIAS